MLSAGRLLSFVPLVFVAGLALFWLLLISLASLLQINLNAGDPKGVLPGLVMWVGYGFLAGTLGNVVLYPVWLLLAVLRRQRSVFIGRTLVFGSSVAVLYAFSPLINWFLD